MKHIISIHFFSHPRILFFIILWMLTYLQLSAQVCSDLPKISHIGKTAASPNRTAH